MTSRWAEDQLHRQAKKEGYRSRAAYKLNEIQNRHHVIRKTDNVVDLGAAPGSWLQVVRSLTSGMVMGIDLVPIPPLEGVITFAGDFSQPEMQDRVLMELEVVNVILSDASPKLTGHRSYDQANAIGIGQDALRFACNVLKIGGNMVIKSFQGDLFDELLTDMRTHFFAIHLFRPRATRRGSAEIYIIGKNFRG
jgi:23S rRNA (uridine2552-2'-O)-methyltransferase